MSDNPNAESGQRVTANEQTYTRAARPRLPEEKELSERTWAELFIAPEHPRSNSVLHDEANRCADENPLLASFGRHFAELDTDHNNFLDRNEIRRSQDWFGNAANDPHLLLRSRNAFVSIAKKLAGEKDEQTLKNSPDTQDKLRAAHDDLVREKTPEDKLGFSLEDLKEQNRTAYLRDGFECLRKHFDQVDQDGDLDQPKKLATWEIKNLAEASQDPYVRTVMYKVLKHMTENEIEYLTKDALERGDYSKDLPSEKDSIRMIEFGTVTALYPS